MTEEICYYSFDQMCDDSHKMVCVYNHTVSGLQSMEHSQVGRIEFMLVQRVNVKLGWQTHSLYSFKLNEQ